METKKKYPFKDLAAYERENIDFYFGREAKTDELILNATSCPMCKRLIINAGIERVIVRSDSDTYNVILVQEWIDNDDSLSGVFGY